MRKYRKHIRLKGFDYSQPLYYFVTVCTANRVNLFEPRVCFRYDHSLNKDVAAELAPLRAELREKAKMVTDIVESRLLGLTKRFSNLETDFYIFMPDHIHMISAIKFRVPGVTLSRIIQAFKSLATREAKQALQLPPKVRIFQPNYYEHIIRSEDNLSLIRNYILKNPQIEHDEINWKRLDPRG